MSFYECLNRYLHLLEWISVFFGPIENDKGVNIVLNLWEEI
jgi:hypothetical protein